MKKSCCKKNIMPDMFLVRVANYFHSIKALHSRANTYKTKTGRALLALSEIKARLNICVNCDKFTGNHCKECGCCTGAANSYFNKLAFPTEECPHPDGPKWGKII